MSKYQVRRFYSFKNYSKINTKIYQQLVNQSTLKYIATQRHLDILLQYDKASRIGAELLEKKSFQVRDSIYKLKSTNNWIFLYRLYSRNQNYQVVIDEEWIPFQKNYQKQLKAVKVIMLVCSRERRIKYGKQIKEKWQEETIKNTDKIGYISKKT